MSDEVRIGALPMALRWHVEPVSWATTDDAGLTIESGPVTDLFIDPGGRAQNLCAPRLLGEVAGDFAFQARVEVAFRDTFDAGALLAWVDDQTWGKLCFEASPAGQPMVVSVVTRGTSDDANAFDVEAARRSARSPLPTAGSTRSATAREVRATSPEASLRLGVSRPRFRRWTVRGPLMAPRERARAGIGGRAARRSHPHA